MLFASMTFQKSCLCHHSNMRRAFFSSHHHPTNKYLGTFIITAPLTLHTTSFSPQLSLNITAHHIKLPPQDPSTPTHPPPIEGNITSEHHITSIIKLPPQILVTPCRHPQTERGTSLITSDGRQLPVPTPHDRTRVLWGPGRRDTS